MAIESRGGGAAWRAPSLPREPSPARDDCVGEARSRGLPRSYWRHGRPMIVVGAAAQSPTDAPADIATMSTKAALALRGRRALRMVAIALLVAGCAGPTIERPPRSPPQAALAPRADGAFAAIEATVHSRGGADASGSELLERNEDGLRWRLALIDSARYSIDATSARVATKPG